MLAGVDHKIVPEYLEILSFVIVAGIVLGAVLLLGLTRYLYALVLPWCV